MEDFVIKVILVGECSVGKTSFITGYCDKDRVDDFYTPTIGVDLKVSRHEVEGKKMKCHIWDTAGQDNFETIVTTYFKGVGAVICMFDITQPSTLTKAESWVRKVKAHNSAEVLPVLLVANKIDRQHEIRTASEAKKMADRNGWLYGEVSAKSGLNVNRVFDNLVEEVYYNVIKKDIQSPGIKVAGSNDKIRLLAKKTEDENKLFKCCTIS